MSEIKRKLKLCSVTSFYSPYLFWLVFHDDIPSRKKLQGELNNPKAKYVGLEKPESGEYVIARNDDDWVRAEIMSISKIIKENHFTVTNYSCFLIDYGIIISTFKVFKLPAAYSPSRVPPIALKGVLYGLTPNITLHERTQTEWLPGIRVIVETIVSNKILQTFYIEKIIDDVLFGDIILEGNGEKISLSKELARKNFASFDKHYDVTQISERPLREIYFMVTNLVGLKPRPASDDHSVTSIRSLEAITKEMSKPGVKIRDDYFSDIDNVLSNRPVRNPNTTSKVFAAGATRKLKTSERMSSIEDDHKKFENVEKLKQAVMQNYKNIEDSLAGLNLEELGSLNEPLGRGRARPQNISRSKSVGRNFGSNIDYQDCESKSGNYYKKYLGRGRQTTNADNFQQTSGNKMPVQLKSILKKDRHSEPNNDDLLTSGRGRNNFNDADASRRLSTYEKFIASGRGRDDDVTKPKRMSVFEKYLASSRGIRKTPEPEKDLPKTCGRGELGFGPEEVNPPGKPSSYVGRVKPENFEDAEESEMKSTTRRLLSKVSGKEYVSSGRESDKEMASKPTDFEMESTRKTPESEIDIELASNPADFETEHNGIKSTTRRLMSKISTDREFRKSTESESDKDMSPKPTDFVKKSSGRGLLLSKIKSTLSESETEKDFPKSTGRHDPKSTGRHDPKGAKKSDYDSDSSANRFSPKSKSSDEQYQDAQESSDSKKSLFRDSPVEEVDGLAAGSNFGCPRKTQQDFPKGSKKRAPNIDFGGCLSDGQNKDQRGKRKIAGLCQCSTCEGWRNNDNVFKEPEQIIKKREPVKIEKPCLLFKTSDKEVINNVPFQNNRHFANETQKLSAPRILVHSCFSVTAIYDLPLISFHEDVQRALRSLNYTNAHSIQVYTWSAILRGDSAIIVSVPDCGKTMVYVPALCSFLYHKRPEISKKTGPQSIIICPTVSVVEDVSRLFNSILKRIDKDHKLISVPYYNNHVCQKLSKHSFDIVVTTPRILIKLYKDDIISLQKLCHIVLEEAHELFNLFPKEVYYILGRVNSVLDNRTCLIPIQVITITQEWNMKIENFAKKFKYPPLICIGAHLETALYGRADIKVQLSNENDKPEKVKNLIKDVYKDSKTLILCNDIQIPRNLISMLESSEIPYETLLLNSAVEEINDIKRKWMTAADNYFVLVCSDNIFNTGLAITDAEVIIQYSLPENWSQFTFRFSGFLDNYSSPINTSAENMKKSVMYIMMDNVNIKPYPKLLQFLQRMKTKITDAMVSIYENLQEESEIEKLDNDVNLCEKFLCFDACKNTISCKYRHMLSPKTDVSPTIPKSGLVKFKVLHVESPIKYSCRLIEHTDSDNNTHEIRDAFGLIATQLLSFKDKLKLVASNKIKVGMVCAVQQIEGIMKGNYQRARILEDVVVAGFNKKVLVRYIDLGFDEQVHTTQLYYLPNHILEHPPQSITVYIADIAPLDYDTTWAQKFMSSFKREFRKCGYNCYFTGRIKLQLGECLFVDDLKLQELIEDYSIVIHKMSVRDTLKNMQAIEIIPRLQKLYKLCEKYNIPLENYSLPEIKVETKIKPQVQPSWAHLENFQEFNEVYFVSAVNPNSFIVRLSKNLPLLDQLHKDIEKAMNKPHYPIVTDVKENYCYALYDNEEDVFARVKITKIKSDMVDCFFVDYGDKKEVHKQELKFLPDEFITKLPFQAIECSLYGVEPTDDVWLEEATDIFYDIATEPNSDIFRSLYVKIVDKEPAQFTGYKKYSVILIDILKYDTIINNVLTEQGLAIPLTDEPIEIDFDKLKESIAQKIISDEDDDDENVEGEKVEEENIEEIIRNDGDLNFDDDKWDLVINNAEEFFAELNIPVKKMSQPEGPEQIAENKSDYLTNIKALPPVDFSTPDIIWQQTESHITLRIQIPNVKIYEANIERSRVFKFRTEIGDREYKVRLTLFDAIENLEHSNMGLYILAKMKKSVEENWPRLIFSKNKMRHIKYNVVSIPVDEESDDERPLTAKMIQSSKILGAEFNKMAEDENGPCIYEYGSDIDWEESDVESDRDSDES